MVGIMGVIPVLKHIEWEYRHIKITREQFEPDIPFFFFFLTLAYSMSVDDTVGWRWKEGSSWLVSSTIGNIGRATATAAKAATKRPEKFIVSVGRMCVEGLLEADSWRFLEVSDVGE